MAAKNETTVDRKSERELVITRTFNAEARIVLVWTNEAGESGQVDG